MKLHHAISKASRCVMPAVFLAAFAALSAFGETGEAGLWNEHAAAIVDAHDVVQRRVPVWLTAPLEWPVQDDLNARRVQPQRAAVESALGWIGRVLAAECVPAGIDRDLIALENWQPVTDGWKDGMRRADVFLVRYENRQTPVQIVECADRVIVGLRVKKEFRVQDASPEAYQALIDAARGVLRDGILPHDAALIQQYVRQGALYVHCFPVGTTVISNPGRERPLYSTSSQVDFNSINIWSFRTTVRIDLVKTNRTARAFIDPYAPRFKPAGSNEGASHNGARMFSDEMREVEHRLKAMPESDARRVCLAEAGRLAGNPDAEPEKLEFYMRGLGRPFDPPEAKVLRQVLMTTRNDGLRAAATRQLSKWITDDADSRGKVLRALAEHVHAPDAEIRQSSLRALGQSGDLRQLKTIIPLLDDADGQVRAATMKAVADLLGWKLPKPADAETLQQQIEQAKQASASVIRALEEAEHVLAGHGPH